MCKKNNLSNILLTIIVAAVTAVSVSYTLSNKKKKPLTVKIKYTVDDPEFEIEKIEKGDWIDLKAAKEIILKKGERVDIPLGVVMKLPKGYEARLLPRSSTCRKLNIWMENSEGVIDNSFCGEKDEWGFRAYAVEDTIIPYGARIAQFRIVESQPELDMVTVKTMEDESRGAFGSTGQM